MCIQALFLGHFLFIMFLTFLGEGLNTYILYRNYRQNVLSSSEVTTPHINETKTLLKLYLILKYLYWDTFIWEWDEINEILSYNVLLVTSDYSVTEIISPYKLIRGSNIQSCNKYKALMKQ